MYAYIYNLQKEALMLLKICGCVSLVNVCSSYTHQFTCVQNRYTHTHPHPHAIYTNLSTRARSTHTHTHTNICTHNIHTPQHPYADRRARAHTQTNIYIHTTKYICTSAPERRTAPIPSKCSDSSRSNAMYS